MLIVRADQVEALRAVTWQVFGDRPATHFEQRLEVSLGCSV